MGCEVIKLSHPLFWVALQAVVLSVVCALPSVWKHDFRMMQFSDLLSNRQQTRLISGGQMGVGLFKLKQVQAGVMNGHY